MKKCSNPDSARFVVASTLVVLCNLGHPGGYSKEASSWLYPSGFPNQRVPSGQARFPDPLPKASGSGNLSTSGHPDPGRNAAHYRVSTNLCQQSHTKLMPSGHSFHNFKYPFFLTTVWIKIIVLSRSILITIQLFPNSAKDLEVRFNFEQATYCLRD